MDVTYAVAATIVVDGYELEDDLAAHVDQLVVDDDLHRPAMFAITLVDPHRDIARRAGLRAGAEVQISIAGQGASDETPIVIGDVVTVECDYDEAGTRIVVRGYAASHRLHAGRRTRAFSDATDSEIVRKVAQEAGLEVGEIESTGEVHEHVTQANQTDWEFLTQRARTLGLDLTITDGKLRLGRRRPSTEAPAEADADLDPGGLDPRQLVFGYNLLAFHGRISAAEQVGSVEVRGWDQARKQPVVATAAAGTTGVGVPSGDPAKLAGAFGSPTFVDVTTPAASAREAETSARALAERIGSAFAEAEGTALGNTALRAGVAVRVSRVSEDFSGAYVLSHTRHVIDRLGYRTHFTVSGRHDRSLLGLVTANGNGTGRAAAGTVEATVGLVRGIVSENDDPERLGRVKVRLPWLDDSFSSTWAPVVQLGAGPASGTFFLPAVGDEVLVGFEHGSVDRPIVVGGLFNGTDKPPTYAQYLDHGAVNGRAIHSRLGHRITLHDARDLSGITLMTAGDEASLGLNANDRKLVLQCQGAIEIESQGEMTLRGSKVTVQADGDLVLKGATIKLN